MAIASPTAPTFSSSFCCNRSDLTRATCITLAARALYTTHRLAISSRLNSSRPSGAGGEFNQYELQYGFAATRRRNGGSPVFVALPVDSVGVGGEVRRKKAMFQSFKALVAAGVEGVVMEVWWGVVERERPGVYDWRGYLEVVALARRCGLKVRVVLSFHQCGTGPGDPRWIPLPLWVLEEIDKDPDIAYSDRLGRRSLEYISLGCDTLPVLRGRSPLQVYADFMKNFRDTFWSLLGVDITGIQVGMGPGGELRYPSCPSEKLAVLYSNALGEFQCYDKYMLASLNACARAWGMHGWGNGMPVGVSDLTNDPENTEFFRKDDGFWNKPYGRFFLEWYSGMLLRHGERICREAEEIFRGIDVNTSAKVARIHWHYATVSHASELTAGYYNTLARDGYLPIARMFGRYKFGLCCSGFELRDVKERPMNISSPEGLLRQLLLATRICELPLEGENSSTNLDDGSFQQVIKMSKFYSDGLERPCFSFNFMRMGKNMFEPGNWVRFTRFVRHMSGINLSRAKLDFGGDVRLNHKQDAVGYGVVYAYC